MNVLMFDPRDYQDERFIHSIEHRSAMAIQSLRGCIEEIFALSESPEGRDQLLNATEHVAGARLALELVWERMRAREAAE